jgi:hypothetical protein
VQKKAAELIREKFNLQGIIKKAKRNRKIAYNDNDNQ